MSGVTFHFLQSQLSKTWKLLFDGFILTTVFFYSTSEIKSSQYTIPDDGRVSEDTKSIIRKLLVVDPTRRMSASHVRESLESTINIWKSISPSASHFQVSLSWNRIFFISGFWCYQSIKMILLPPTRKFFTSLFSIIFYHFAIPLQRGSVFTKIIILFGTMGYILAKIKLFWGSRFGART